MVKRALQQVFRILFGMRSNDSTPDSPIFHQPPGERLCCYLFEKGHFRGGVVRFNGVMPAKDGAKSSCWAGKLSDIEVWGIGKKHVEPERKRAILARADFNSLSVYGAGLRVDLNNNPFPRHADILGWHKNSAFDRHMAQKIADAAGKPIANPSVTAAYAS